MVKSIVVLSGGQDSMTTYFLAKQKSEVVAAVHFDYNQKHGIPEQSAARKLCKREGIEFKVITLEDLLEQVGRSGLFELSRFDMSKPHPDLPEVPASFVPGRNLLFLTLAAAVAVQLGARELWTGVCQTDYSGYPDCRRETITYLELALNLGLGTLSTANPEVTVNMSRYINIVTPLMDLTKAETFAAAEACGELKWIIENSHTCYEGNHELRHEWGYGCGKCPACQVREKGWKEFKGVKTDA